MNRQSILAVCGLALNSLFPALAGTIQVPGDHATIQAAIDVVTSGDVIVVGPGTYFEQIDFKGKAIALRSSAGPGNTVIDATGLGGSVVVCINGEGLDTVLEGFTIKGGSATVGGGMRNDHSSPTVVNCTFTENVAADRGGGMYNFGGSPVIAGCKFIDNFAAAMGGGIFNRESSPTITGCLFLENSSNKGGGMRNYIDSHPTVTDCVFLRNTAFEEGGGMDNRKNSNPTVTNCAFIENTAASGGGGMHNYVGNAVATGNPSVTNCLFAANSSATGGGMRNNDPSPAVTNCTFVGNTGTAMSSRNGSTPTLTNCILWGNTGGSFSGANSPFVSHSNVEDGFIGTGNIRIDPLFIDPDGPDDDPLTWEDNDYRISIASPSVDAADNAVVPPDSADLDGDGDTLEPTPLDLAGSLRFTNGFANCRESPVVDMGAYESSGTNQVWFDVDGTKLTWSAVAGAQSYNVYLGDVSALADSDLDGQSDDGHGACMNDLDTDASDTAFTANEVPVAGDGFFYLVSFVDSLGAESDLGFTTACVQRVPAGSCP